MASTVFYTEQRFSINPTYIVSTPVFTGGNWVRSTSQRKAEVNLKDNATEGLLSKKAASRLRNAVNWLVESASYKRVYSKIEQKHFYFKVNFITLTIPKQPSADIASKELQKLLHSFLVYARKYFYLKNYVWKIERGSLGKIHIHVTSDTFIHYRRLRDCWNRILMKSGYSNDYYAIHGHYDPNSTDVHSVRKIKNLGGYLCKYMAKDSGLGKDFKNRIWGCNYELSASNKCTYYATPDTVAKVTEPLLSNDIQYKPILSKPDAMGQQKTIGEIFFPRPENWASITMGVLKTVYDKHRSQIRSQEHKPPDSYYCIDEIESTLPKQNQHFPAPVVAVAPVIVLLPVKELLLFELN